MPTTISEKIAIVGVGGIFPGAPSLEDFWRIVSSGINTAAEIPAHRWCNQPDSILSEGVADDRVYSKRACLIDGFQLDYSGLNLDEQFVNTLDPMFHLLLHAGRNAWQDAQTERVNKERTGIVIGNIALPTEYASRYTDEILDPIFCKQLNLDIPEKEATNPINRYVAGLPAGLLAQGLGLGAGTYTLDAACASSLYAVKYAADALISGQCDCVLAGGLSRPDSQYTQMGFAQLHALSKSGNCSPFSDKADGLVVGEGACIFVLKRLDDALKDNDHIYACIAGAGLSNDIEGNLFLPASEGQTRAMQSAYQQSAWPVDSVDLIECHGTGTPKGDQIEFASLNTLWSDITPKQQCVIGSVKSNVGHLLTGAGAAGLMKVLLSLKHKQLPPTANFQHAADGIELSKSAFRVLKSVEDWPRPEQHPRRAAISAFGFGGINAHLLIEEFEAAESAPRISYTYHDEPIAIVGQSAHFSDLTSIDQVRERYFNHQNIPNFKAPTHWYGDSTTELHTAPIVSCGIPIGRFRIPPTELADCLPQQLLMLNVAADALDSIQNNEERRLRFGTYIGIGLDPNTCNFHYRWRLEKLVKEQWGTDLDPIEQEQWIDHLRNTFGPPLTANRTMGALGGIVASRIARALSIGGPSFTISNEECSGVQALKMGVDALRRGDIDHALVGAVDFNADIRATLSHNHTRTIGKRPGFLTESDASITSDGACAFIIKRLSDAKRDGDTVIACVDDVYTAHGGNLAGGTSTTDALQRCLRDAYPDGHHLKQLDLIISHGSGNRCEDSIENEAYSNVLSSREKQRPCAISNVINDIGHCGAAVGLAGVLKAALSLEHKMIPQLRHQHGEQNFNNFDFDAYASKQSHYWLRDRKNDQRVAGVTTLSCDGNATHVVLCAHEEAAQLEKRPIHHYKNALFLLNAANERDLLDLLAELKHFCEAYTSLDEAAHHWWHSNKSEGPVSCSIVASHNKELDYAISELTGSINENNAITGPLAFYYPGQSEIDGDLAFVYPGSGNHYAGMCASHSSYWPQVFAAQDEDSHYHAAQFAHGRFWSENDCNSMDHRDVIFGQVCCGTMMTDVMLQFGITYDAIIGYSLGETAGFFSSKTWRDRDEMLKRINDSALFTEQLAGPCTAVQKTWNDSSEINWSIASINVDANTVKQHLKDYDRLYLLIINTPEESVIGGDKVQLEMFIDTLQCQAHAIDGVTTVHCPVAEPVAKDYRDLHLFDVHPPKNVRFYSGIWAKSYEVTTDSAADSVIGQALDTFSYADVIKQAYADGTRIFLEMGPKGTCARMIDKILADKPHLAMSCNIQGQDASQSVMLCLAQIHCTGRRLDLSPLYGHALPEEDQRKYISVEQGKSGFDFIAKPSPKPVIHQSQISPDKHSQKAVRNPSTVTASAAPQLATDSISPTINDQWQRSQTSMQRAHEQFLQLQANAQQTIARALAWQQQAISGNPTQAVMEVAPIHTQVDTTSRHPVNPSPSGESVLFDYHQCMEIAVGKLGNVLPDFAEADQYPTRVRLPDEPLMLAHRIMRIDGEAKSMTSGRIVTEHDIKQDAWYLDCGVIPTCIAVEAGQADLFLSGYLGIDFITKGLATYRLLDAEVCFYQPLPGPGSYIRYDIQILEFFKQGDTHLFRFQFDATVNGELLLTMRKGIAGFFTQAELDAGKGVVLTKLDTQKQTGVCPEDWAHPVTVINSSYSEQDLQALRNGNIAACFGDAFKDLPLSNPATIPDGLMRLVHRIKSIDPVGGRFGLGQIVGEADIHPDDWFLTCHFCDDMVMPGTLMYECCLHTLRVYLLRIGWIGEADEIHYEPVPGISSILKCRGQVLQTTKMVTYELTVKEIGYRDHDQKPYCIADALMYGDGKAIVHMKNMSVQIAGLSKEKIDALWSAKTVAITTNNPLHSDPDFINDAPIFTDQQITAFAEGNPSEAFGDRYKIFDSERKIARLPRDPFKFLNRITQIRDCAQWELSDGGTIVARYDVPIDAWYFRENEQGGTPSMPFSVLLETALQPCGWLAAYLGSALTNDQDIKFRNLGGSAEQFIEVTPDIGTLSTKIYISNVSASGGMIIQNYDMEMWSERGLVYKGDTVFGFFSVEALANQIGIRGAQVYEADGDDLANGRSFAYPAQAPFPSPQMRMIKDITHYNPNGGRHGLGGIIGTMPVDPDAWFFQAHFYQDPVIPGSLGLESFLQLLKVHAYERWAEAGKQYHFEAMKLNHEHKWVYRGQVIPRDHLVTVSAEVVEQNDQERSIIAEGFLSIDGRVIYQMMRFGIRLIEK